MWIRESTARMSCLIDDLLRPSRIGRTEARFENVDQADTSMLTALFAIVTPRATP